MFGDTKLHIKINGQSGASMSPINTHKHTVAAAAVSDAQWTQDSRLQGLWGKNETLTSNSCGKKHDTSRTPSLFTSWFQPQLFPVTVYHLHVVSSQVKRCPFSNYALSDSIAFVSNSCQLVPAPYWSDDDDVHTEIFKPQIHFLSLHRSIKWKYSRLLLHRFPAFSSYPFSLA